MMGCSSNQRARQGAHCVLDTLPAELFPPVAKLLPAADLARMESTSRALQSAVERAVREQAAGWGGFGTGAVERVAGESWAALSLFIELRMPLAPGRLAAGGDNTVAATSTGALWAWGGGDSGQLGHGDTQDQLVPRRVEALAAERVVHVAAGTLHTLAVTSTGAVWAWGRGDYGQLGHGDRQNQLVPRRVGELCIHHS